jgi:hypothetical protein
VDLRADPVGAVLGLQRLHQRPGPLQEDHRARGRQRQADPAGAGGGAHQVELTGLEGLDVARALARRLAADDVADAQPGLGRSLTGQHHQLTARRERQHRGAGPLLEHLQQGVDLPARGLEVDVHMPLGSPVRSSMSGPSSMRTSPAAEASAAEWVRTLSVSMTDSSWPSGSSASILASKSS